MAVNLYVGNLPYRIDEDSLRQLFTPYGNVETSKVIKDRQTGRSKGFGFIEMSSQAEADAAIKALNETALDGRNLKVNFAKPKEPRQRRLRGPVGQVFGPERRLSPTGQLQEVVQGGRPLFFGSTSMTRTMRTSADQALGKPVPEPGVRRQGLFLVQRELPRPAMCARRTACASGSLPRGRPPRRPRRWSSAPAPAGSRSHGTAPPGSAGSPTTMSLTTSRW